MEEWQSSCMQIMKDFSSRYQLPECLTREAEKLFKECMHECVVSLRGARSLTAACLYASSISNKVPVHVQAIVTFCELSDRGRKKVFWQSLSDVMEKQKQLQQRKWLRDQAVGTVQWPEFLGGAVRNDLNSESSAVWTQHSPILRKKGITFARMLVIDRACDQLMHISPGQKATALAAMLMLQNRLARIAACCTREPLPEELLAGEAADLTNVSSSSVRRHLQRMIRALPPSLLTCPNLHGQDMLGPAGATGATAAAAAAAAENVAPPSISGGAAATGLQNVLAPLLVNTPAHT